MTIKQFIQNKMQITGINGQKMLKYCLAHIPAGVLSTE